MRVRPPRLKGGLDDVRGRPRPSRPPAASAAAGDGDMAEVGHLPDHHVRRARGGRGRGGGAGDDAASRGGARRRGLKGERDGTNS